MLILRSFVAILGLARGTEKLRRSGDSPNVGLLGDEGHGRIQAGRRSQDGRLCLTPSWLGEEIWIDGLFFAKLLFQCAKVFFLELLVRRPRLEACHYRAESLETIGTLLLAQFAPLLLG